MGTCTCIIKYLVFAFNFGLWLLGCAILSVGVWIKVDDSAGHEVQRMTQKVDEAYQINYSAIGEEDLTVTISYVLIAFGLILIVVTFIGCCGAVRENTCLLATFAVCLFVLMVALIGVGIWAYVKKGDVTGRTPELKKVTDANVERAVQLYHTDQSSKEFMDNIQERFTCCGADNMEKDYGTKDRIPKSCKRGHYQRRCTDRYYYFVADEIEEFLEHRYTVISAVALGVGCCLAFGVLITLLLCCIIKRSSSVRVS